MSRQVREPKLAAQFDDLRGGVVLAELGGHGDGPYCAVHGAGAALVVLGTYIVDPGDSVPYAADFVFQPGRESYNAYLQEHVAAARHSEARVGVSVVSVELADSVDFVQAAQDAGADHASLCLHSVMEMFVSKGVSSALCWPENFGRLREWSRAVVESVAIPVIFKIGASAPTEPLGAVETISGAGGQIIHINIGDGSRSSRGLALLGELKGKCDLLIAGGGIQDVEGARRVLGVGADAIAIATAAMDDPTLCGRIQRQLRDG